jgi:hypothetical protein
MTEYFDDASQVCQLAELNERIGDLKAKRDRIQREYSLAKRAQETAKADRGYRRLQKWIRSPVKSYSLWPLGLMLVGPLIPGSLTFAFAQILSGSFTTAFGYFVVIAGVVAAFLGYMLFVPGDARLEWLVNNAEINSRHAQDFADKLLVHLSNAEQALRAATHSRDTIERSVQYKRELLLRQNWKAMRGPEWEEYLADIFQLLGGTVE